MTLWNKSVDTYNVHPNQTFKTKAALMWTVNDFPTYGMLSGWSTYGALSCQVYQDNVVKKCLGLIPIVVFCHESTLSGEIRTLL